ncbi:MAG: hypothetical protein WBC91_20585 [Phototrophicaceae bacterium]
MQIPDFWDDLQPVFEGRAEQLQEIDLVNISKGSMAQCIYYLLTRAKECNSKFMLRDNKTQVMLPSPTTVIDYVLQGQVTMAMWITLPAIPMLSVYIDFTDEISFGYVRGSWDAMAVLAFFDMLYEIKQLCPHSVIRPSTYTYTVQERNAIKHFWKDYDHASE